MNENTKLAIVFFALIALIMCVAVLFFHAGYLAGQNL